MSLDWSVEEVRLTVADYFDMLELELTGNPYIKRDHSRALEAKIPRSKKAIENKHQNISAVLDEHGLPSIIGYKRLDHYQQLLAHEVLRYLNDHTAKLTPLFEAFAEEVPSPPEPEDILFEGCIEDPPKISEKLPKAREFRPVKINYLEREQANRTLGAAGEDWVKKLEISRLLQAGLHHLIQHVRIVSQEEGDGLGYDIISKNDDGSSRFIEVKTTKRPKDAAFFVTATEVDFAKQNAENFYLYRVFKAGPQQKFFILQGEYDLFCRLEPTVYRGAF